MHAWIEGRPVTSEETVAFSGAWLVKIDIVMALFIFLMLTIVLFWELYSMQGPSHKT